MTTVHRSRSCSSATGPCGVVASRTLSGVARPGSSRRRRCLLRCRAHGPPRYLFCPVARWWRWLTTGRTQSTKGRPWTGKIAAQTVSRNTPPPTSPPLPPAASSPRRMKATPTPRARSCAGRNPSRTLPRSRRPKTNVGESVLACAVVMAVSCRGCRGGHASSVRSAGTDPSEEPRCCPGWRAAPSRRRRPDRCLGLSSRPSLRRPRPRHRRHRHPPQHPMRRRPRRSSWMGG